MKITLKQLRLIGACEPQVDLFKETFGTEAELTVENAIRYGALFDINWIANKVLKGDKLADYRAKRDALYADYRAKCATAFVEAALVCYKSRITIKDTRLRGSPRIKNQKEVKLT